MATFLPPNWSNYPLSELETKRHFLWEEHHILDEEAVALRKREEEIEHRMQEITVEAEALKQHMKSLYPTNSQDIKVLLQLITEEVQYLSILEGTDETVISSIIAMVASVQKAYVAYIAESKNY